MQWISVKDYMPSFDGDNLSNEVHIKYKGKKRPGYYDNFLKCWFVRKMFDIYEPVKIELWMPKNVKKE